MGPMIPKEMKYNLHYGKVRGDVLDVILTIFLIWASIHGNTFMLTRMSLLRMKPPFAIIRKDACIFKAF